MLIGFRSPRAALYTVDFMHRLADAAVAITRGEEAPMIYGEGNYIFGGDGDAGSAPRYRERVALSPQLFTTGIAYSSLGS
jgi:hypothetical protein